MPTLRSTLTALLVAAGLVLATPGPASAHGDRQRAEEMRKAYAADGGSRTSANVPLIESSNVSLLSTHPGSAGISGCFLKSAPVFVMSSLDSVKVFDVSDPPQPRAQRHAAQPAVRERGDELRRAEDPGRHEALRDDRRRPPPGLTRRHRARQRRRRQRAGRRGRHRPGRPPHRRACPGDDEHAHGLLHRHDRLPLRLLGR